MEVLMYLQNINKQNYLINKKPNMINQPVIDEIAVKPFSYLDEGINLDNYDLEPLKDRLLLKEIKIEEKSKGGIILVEKEENKEYFYGEVLESGNGKELESGRIPNTCQKGDIILFNPRSAFPLKIKGEELLIIRDNEAIVRLRSKPI